MTNALIRRLIILGGISIIGIIFVQTYWLLKTWDIKDREFDQSVNIVLRNVADRIAKFNNVVLPKTQLIQRKSSNYYAVNVNTTIDAGLLEQYLLLEMDEQALKIDFEYAVYNCESDELVYGNYCSAQNMQEDRLKISQDLPKFDDLIYYFVVRFPNRESFLMANKNMTLTLTLLSALAIGFFLYSIWIIMEQKRLSELQKDFINNMTHEFKTPISSIKIASDFLAKHPYIESDERLSRYIHVIRQQNSRLNDQVEKVLNIARLEKDSIELKKEEFDLVAVLNGIINNESLKLKEGHITFSSDFDSVPIRADKLHFINVVANIIDNGIKYSQNEPHIHISLNDAEDYMLLKITDNGIGIDKENQKKLFDKFFRVSTGNIHNIKGFGLGLFYVKNICQAHGWTIDVESEPGQGSSFIIKIIKNKNL
jgi:two-component system phosphate regulon sensor histidine kinase PhoR